MELKVNNLPSLNTVEKVNTNSAVLTQVTEKEKTNIDTSDIYNSLNVNKGSAIPQYNLVLSKDPNEIKDNLKEISNSIKSELKNFIGTDNLKEVQNIVGAEETGDLDNQTADKLSTFISADNFIKGHIDNIIKYREFEASINLFRLQMKMLDEALKIIK